MKNNICLDLSHLGVWRYSSVVEHYLVYPRPEFHPQYHQKKKRKYFRESQDLIKCFIRVCLFSGDIVI